MHHRCPNCSQPIIRDQNTIGRMVACPNCGEQSLVPETERRSTSPILVLGTAALLVWLAACSL